MTQSVGGAEFGPRGIIKFPGREGKRTPDSGGKNEQWYHFGQRKQEGDQRSGPPRSKDLREEEVHPFPCGCPLSRYPLGKCGDDEECVAGDLLVMNGKETKWGEGRVNKVRGK